MKTEAVHQLSVQLNTCMFLCCPFLMSNSPSASDEISCDEKPMQNITTHVCRMKDEGSAAV
ncbi:hypothetical protein I315_00797 [Cryptococcus gattii Ru294]|nr:hypothetical protein I315_00797 [Cryptococcus gattii Ru294]